MDTAAVSALALQIVVGVARIVDAQAQAVRLVPQVDTGPHAAMASTAATDPFTPDPGKLAALAAAKTQLDTASETRVPGLDVQVSPQLFAQIDEEAAETSRSRYASRTVEQEPRTRGCRERHSGRAGSGRSTNSCFNRCRQFTPNQHRELGRLTDRRLVRQ